MKKLNRNLNSPFTVGVIYSEDIIVENKKILEKEKYTGYSINVGRGNRKIFNNELQIAIYILNYDGPIDEIRIIEYWHNGKKLFKMPAYIMLRFVESLSLARAAKEGVDCT